MSVFGIPVMTKRVFIKTEHSLGTWWWKVLEESMKTTGQEEKRLAIERRDFHQGIPAITVIVDGGWSKRTHKHSYNAKSGTAIIIGKETGKILFIGVRNKYCSACAHGKKVGKENSNHTCFKNWSGSSSSMETDILVDGFQKAESQHGVRYLRFIGDGDSSVHPDLVAKVPVWGYAIRKIECANHATKCYRSALEKLVQDNKSYKGKGKFTETMRMRLAKAARCAISMRSCESNQQLAVKLLREDLQNGPLHCFGYHSKCSKDFCTTQKQVSPTSDSPVVPATSPPSLSTSTSPSPSTSASTSSSSLSPLPPSLATAVSSSSSRPPPPAAIVPSSTSSSQPTASVSTFPDGPETVVTPDDIRAILDEQVQAWTDTMDDTDIEAVRSVEESHSEVDPRMLCDIQRLVGRLVAKADQLLGTCTYIVKVTHYFCQ